MRCWRGLKARASYVTAGRDAEIDWKALSKRIGHADVAFTMKQYVQTDLEADRQVANTLATLILGARSPPPRSRKTSLPWLLARGCRGSDAQGWVLKIISAKRLEMIFRCP